MANVYLDEEARKPTTLTRLGRPREDGVRVPAQDRSRRRGLLALAVVAGPGIVVMLADTEVGSIVTAAQSGARWGYRLLLLQILLVPVLFVVQELAVRLGIITGKGHGELIRDHFGPRWAWLSVSALLVACAGALVTEFVGVQAVGGMLGVPSWASLGLAAGFLLVVVGTGSFRRVEIVALLLGGVSWRSSCSPHARTRMSTRSCRVLCICRSAVAGTRIWWRRISAR